MQKVQNGCFNRIMEEKQNKTTTYMTLQSFRKTVLAHLLHFILIDTGVCVYIDIYICVYVSFSILILRMYRFYICSCLHFPLIYMSICYLSYMPVATITYKYSMDYANYFVLERFFYILLGNLQFIGSITEILQFLQMPSMRPEPLIVE